MLSFKHSYIAEVKIRPVVNVVQVPFLVNTFLELASYSFYDLRRLRCRI